MAEQPAEAKALLAQLFEAAAAAMGLDRGTENHFPHPLMVPVRPGMPVEGHEGPLIFWGPEHVPRRLTHHRVERKKIAPP
jgi:hypothetical protein